LVNWNEIPGWFQWRSGQEEATRRFPEGSRFVEVGNYLGRSLCSLGEVAPHHRQALATLRDLGLAPDRLDWLAARLPLDPSSWST
jgi:hypothetical protein